MLVRQLEEELRLRMRQPAPELQQQLEALYAENEHLQREIAILRDTIKVSETSQRQFLAWRRKENYFLIVLRVVGSTPADQVDQRSFFRTKGTYLKSKLYILSRPKHLPVSEYFQLPIIFAFNSVNSTEALRHRQDLKTYLIIMKLIHISRLFQNL